MAKTSNQPNLDSPVDENHGTWAERVRLFEYLSIANANDVQAPKSAITGVRAWVFSIDIENSVPVDPDISIMTPYHHFAICQCDYLEYQHCQDCIWRISESEYDVNKNAGLKLVFELRHTLTTQDKPASLCDWRQMRTFGMVLGYPNSMPADSWLINDPVQKH